MYTHRSLRLFAIMLQDAVRGSSKLLKMFVIIGAILGGFCGINLRSNLLSEHFSQFDSPLIKRAEIPHKALSHRSMLKNTQNLSRLERIQMSIKQQQRTRSVASKHLMRHQKLNLLLTEFLRLFQLFAHFIRSLTNGQRIALSKEITHQLVVIALDELLQFLVVCVQLIRRQLRSGKADKIHRNHSTLMDQLEKRVLCVGARFTKVDLAAAAMLQCRIPVQIDAFAVRLHI
mmetsp:Transcript_18577/g.29428  ORF Transcript_18577/g.29428 Transcript_18577/m.29428 type:complete len:231 (-) Transcript_18577:739-1431(-)